MSVWNSHYLQLFDTSESLAVVVSEFIRDGFAQGDAVLALTTAPHWQLIRHRCRELGVDVAAGVAADRLVVIHPEEILDKLMYRDRVSWERFDAILGGVVRQLRAGPGRLRVYGEAVDVLVRRNRFDAAEQLEECWNRLATTEPFHLFCSYLSEHFGNPRDAASLRRICDLHTSVHTHTEDVLGAFLLKAHTAV